MRDKGNLSGGEEEGWSIKHAHTRVHALCNDTHTQEAEESPKLDYVCL